MWGVVIVYSISLQLRDSPRPIGNILVTDEMKSDKSGRMQDKMQQRQSLSFSLFLFAID